MRSQMKTFTAAGGGANAAFVHRSSRNRHETEFLVAALTDEYDAGYRSSHLILGKKEN